MKITKFRLRTHSGEMLKLNEVNGIIIGGPLYDRPDAWNKNGQLICIMSERGNNNFDLNDVGELSFNIEKEKLDVMVGSRLVDKEEDK